MEKRAADPVDLRSAVRATEAGEAFHTLVREPLDPPCESNPAKPR